MQACQCVYTQTKAKTKKQNKNKQTKKEREKKKGRKKVDREMKACIINIPRQKMTCKFNSFNMLQGMDL